MAGKENEDSKPDEPSLMRKKAEERLEKGGDKLRPAANQGEAMAQVHELRVGHVELEMQNEKLLRARSDADEAAKRWSDLFDFAPVGYFVWNKEGRIVQINLAGAKMLGLYRERAVGKNFMEFLQEEERPRFLDFCNRALAQEGKQTCETVILGAQRAVPALIHAIRTESPSTRMDQGEVPSIMGAVIDVSDQKRADELEAANSRLRRAEKALRESEDRLKLALTSGKMGIWEWEAATNRLVWNDSMFHLLGLPIMEAGIPEDLFFSRVHPEDIDSFRRGLDEVREGGSDWSREFRVVHALTGEVRWLVGSARVFRDAKGTFTRMVGVNYDITERKRSERELLQAKAKADEANQAKDRFLAALSHELRTPLTPILASAQMLERREDLPSGVWEYVDVIKRNVGLEARLIDDLLDLNRIIYGKAYLAISDVDMHEVIKQAAETCKPKLLEKRLKISFRLNARAHMVRGDWSRLQQILWNLLTNSIKFTQPEGEISISTKNALADNIQVIVSDNGRGIDRADLPKLFFAFEQGGITSGQFGGLGLGLAICRGLSELHHGTLSAYSEGRDRGSTFTLTLPAQAVIEVEAEKAEAAEQKVKSQSQKASKKILLVEDNRDTGILMKAVLDGDGHKVRIASDVASALKAAEGETFDLLLCDIGLPDGSGLDVISAMRKQHSVGKAIAMTGYGMEEDVRRCKDAGFDTHLTKPVDIDQLERLIAAL